MDRSGGGMANSSSEHDNRCPCGRQLDMLGVYVTPTTGGQFELRVASTDSVDFLRRLVSKRLRVPKERICLLYRDRHLREGSLVENSILDGARITLLPSVETGLLTQRPEQSVMQALESLNDGQVNDFLTGKAPLNLTMRLGDHMMLIQLQLSTVSPTGSSRTKSRTTVPSTHTAHTHTHTNAHTTSHETHQPGSHTHPSTHPLTPPYTPQVSAAGGCSGYTPVHTPHLAPPSHTTLTSPTKVKLNPSQPSSSMSSTTASSTSSASATSYPLPTQQSPTHSTPTTTPPHQHYLHHHRTNSGSSNSSSYSFSGSSSPSSPPPPHLSTPPHNHHHHHYHHHHHLHRHHCHSPGGSGSPSNSPNSSVGSPSTPGGGLSWDSDLPIRGCPHRGEEFDPRASLDTKALAEASRNLTQTLKQLSSEVLTSKPEPKEETLNSHDQPRTSSVRHKSSDSNNHKSSSSNSTSTSSTSSSTTTSSKSSGVTSAAPSTSSPSAASSSAQTTSSCSKKQGAIIESMHHHGKGVYSGTFSGTLNPALQDRNGRPKRDISTIIHILNDLLCATPQYRRHNASISLSTTTPSSNSTNSSKSKSSSSNKTASSTIASEYQQLLLQQQGGAGGDSRRATNLSANDDKSKESSATENDIDENTAMRNKLEEIRSKLEQRRARRKARREQRSSPYPITTSWSSETTTIPNSIATGATTEVSSPGGGPGSSQAMEVESSETGDQPDQAHLCQLNSETVVA